VTTREWPKLEGSVQSVLGARNAFLVEMTERKERGRRILQVFIDTDEGITIAQCAEISRELDITLDEQNIINEPYELEVSSPGIEKPLKLLRQYKKNLGRKYKVQYLQGDDRQTFSGTLAAIDGERLTFTLDKQEAVTLEFSKIIESIEELPW
jgi:ribosome maturation factor RimP